MADFIKFLIVERSDVLVGSGCAVENTYFRSAFTPTNLSGTSVKAAFGEFRSGHHYY